MPENVLERVAKAADPVRPSRDERMERDRAHERLACRLLDHLVDRGVHLCLGGDTEVVEQLEQAPDAHAIAVVSPAEDAVALGLIRRRDRGPLAGAEAERLDVERYVDSQAASAGPGIVRPLG